MGDQYKKHFVGKEGGINMMKIRVKVSFYNSARALICSSISPQTVVDNGSKKIGCMEMYDCWPRKSSPSGGRKIMMISEYDLADDVVPKFEVYDAEGIHRMDVEEWIVQPIKSASTMAIKNATIIFLTPAQPHLEKIQNQIGSFSLKLVAHRQGDGMTSKAFAFEYTTCCDHRMDGDEEAKIEGQDRAKPGCKKRNLKRQTLQVPSVKKARTRMGSDEVREVLNWKREDVTHDQTLKAEESFDQMSNSSHNGNSEDDLMDILNIPRDHLLDANSPERPDDIPQEHQDSEEELQMDTLNTPVVMPDLATLWGGSNTQVVRSKQNVILPQRNGGFIQTDSTNNPKTFKDEDFSPSTGPPEEGLRSRHANRVQKKTTNVVETVENSTSKTDLAQLLMVFTVFFILLRIVQISSNSLGLPLTTLPLIGI